MKENDFYISYINFGKNLFSLLLGTVLIITLTSFSDATLGESEVETSERTSKRSAELDAFFNIEEIPEIRLDFTLEEWNKLLTYYDEDSENKNFVKCNIHINSNNRNITIETVGVRIRGGASRKRPEGNWGQMHTADDTNWHQCSFAINLNKFIDGEDRTVGGVESFDLKYFNIDSAYVREIYCYDLFRKFGVTTSVRASYCKVTVSVEGDSKPAYYGVYMLQEHIDKVFLKDRTDVFGDAKGNLWKCRRATLADASDNLFFVDDNSSDVHNYELKTNKKKFEEAKLELQQFIIDFQEKEGDEFHDWIRSKCDIELLLKTYAVNVAVGNWDDYWNNKHNYYIYFNKDSKFFFIPFDMDNSLGICYTVGRALDTPYDNPFEWGINECNLISKILQFEDYRSIYRNALKDLVSPLNSYLNYEPSVSRILCWEQMIAPYVDNDTHEHNTISDSTLGTHSEYKLLEDSENNYFKLRCSVIDDYIKADVTEIPVTVTKVKYGTFCDITKDNLYNLTGQQIAHPTKGIYILNGKKYVIK